MTKCQECGKNLHPKDPGVMCVGFTADGALYRHAGACQEAAEERRVNSSMCRHCKRSFPRRPDEKRAGRPAEYCGDTCRKAHARGVATLWKQAAKGDLPDSIEACIQRKNAVSALFNDLRAGRFNGLTPATAKDTLLRYHHQVERHERELVKALRADRSRAAAEDMREWVKSQQAAHEDSWSMFLGSLEEDAK